MARSSFVVGLFNTQNLSKNNKFRDPENRIEINWMIINYIQNN